MLSIEEQTHEALHELKRARVALHKAIGQAGQTHCPDARVEVQRLLDAMLKKKRQFEELAIVRDALWQNDYRQ